MEALLLGLAALVLWFAIEGYRHGVVRRAVEVLGLILVFLFASRLAGALEPELAASFDWSPRVAFFASWVAVLVGGVIGVRLLAVGLSKLIRFSVVGWMDRAGGIALGAAFGTLLASVVLIGVLAAPFDSAFKNEVRDHAVTGRVLHLAPAVYDVARTTWQGESFFAMVRDHVQPKAEQATETLRALVEDAETDEDSH